MKTIVTLKNSYLELTFSSHSKEDKIFVINFSKKTCICDYKTVKIYNTLRFILTNPKIIYNKLHKKLVHTNWKYSNMPNSLDSKINSNFIQETSNCGNKCKLDLPYLESPPNSPSQEWWFKTWPERYDKMKTGSWENIRPILRNLKHNHVTSSACNESKNAVNVNCKVTLDEALQNISLAYSPLTKQLHLLSENKNNVNVPQLNSELKSDQKDVHLVHRHKRNEPGSFSSTISSLSDPSSSGSAVDGKESYCTSSEDENYKCSKKDFIFFNRNLFSWKSHSSLIGWRLFNKRPYNSNSSQQKEVMSSSALIENIRPSNLPAKTVEEERRHRKEYKAIIAAAKRKEMEDSVAKQKQQKMLLKQEEQLSASTKHFLETVIPNWETMQKSRKTKDLWWQGLPSSIRGKIWRLAIGNELNITHQLYEICLQRAQNRLGNPELPNCNAELDQESSMDVIQLDISRTFPQLCIFQKGGPYFDILHSLLAAYVCYRPDVGYVQGMSYIAAILILNMDEVDAFISFANLLNRPLHLAAFTLNQDQMQAYYTAYNDVFKLNLSKLYTHFEESGLTPDLYLLDWIYTIYAKAMPLDIACRIWDIFLRDGEEFIFRTALGVLHLNQDILLQMDFIHGAQFLIRLPEDLSSDLLFKSIQAVSINIGKQSFTHIVDKYKQIG